MAIVENIFLLAWAVFSNTKEFVLDFTLDTVSKYFGEETFLEKLLTDDVRSKKKRKKQYLRQLKRQMGFYTKKSAEQLKNKNSTQPESNNKAEDPLALDLDLESELQMLKGELAKLGPQQTAAPVAAFVPPPPPPPPPMKIPPPPPPPMAPQTPLKATSAVVSAALTIPTTTTMPCPAAPPRAQSFTSIADAIKSGGHHLKLRKATTQASPVTPVKSASSNENPLFSALKNKFKIVEQMDDDSDADSDTFSPAKPAVKPADNTTVSDKENVSPIKSSTFTKQPNTPLSHHAALKQALASRRPLSPSNAANRLAQTA